MIIPGLIDEGILEVSIGTDDKTFAKETSSTINQCKDIIFPTDSNGNLKISEEMLGILNDTVGTEKGQHGVDEKFFWWFYAKKLHLSIKLLMEGKTCLHSSEVMEQLLHHFINTNSDVVV